MTGNRKEPTELQKAREDWRDFSRDMYGFALAQLEENLESLETEGVGDCWLLVRAIAVRVV